MSTKTPTFSERVLVVLAILLWIVFLLAGILVPSKPYREDLTAFGGLTVGKFLLDLFMTVTCYTITNVPILCCLAAVVGAGGSRVGLGVDMQQTDSGKNMSPYFSSVLRAFFTYLLVLSGTLLSINDSKALLDATQDQYIRMAGTLSLIGFMFGYNPELFGRFFKMQDKIPVSAT